MRDGTEQKSGGDGKGEKKTAFISLHVTINETGGGGLAFLLGKIQSSIFCI